MYLPIYIYRKPHTYCVLLLKPNYLQLLSTPLFKLYLNLGLNTTSAFLPRDAMILHGPGRNQWSKQCEKGFEWKLEYSYCSGLASCLIASSSLGRNGRTVSAVHMCIGLGQPQVHYSFVAILKAGCCYRQTICVIWWLLGDISYSVILKHGLFFPLWGSVFLFFKAKLMKNVSITTPCLLTSGDGLANPITDLNVWRAHSAAAQWMKERVL